MNKKILVIEDNIDVRENIEELLQLSGYNVFTAENGKDGISKALANNPDLILCDIMMPEMDGFGVLRILSNNPTTMNTPFIFLTAKAEKDDFRKGMGLGADDYIIKPFDDVDLLNTIEMRLNKNDRIKTAFSDTSQGLQRFFDEAKGQKEFEKLIEDREIRSYNRKDTIFEAGQYPKWLYYVESGSVKSYQINDIGKEYTTNIYSQGEFFGYIPLLKNEKYQATVSAIDNCELRLISIEDFTLLLYNNKEFAAKFIKILANQSDEAEKQLLELAYSSVRKRVANALLKFSDSKNTTTMKVLRDDIANLAGTAKETTIRTLSEFKSEGIINIDEKIIELIDIEKLRNMPH